MSVTKYGLGVHMRMPEVGVLQEFVVPGSVPKSLEPLAQYFPTLAKKTWQYLFVDQDATLRIPGHDTSVCLYVEVAAGKEVVIEEILEGSRHLHANILLVVGNDAKVQYYCSNTSEGTRMINRVSVVEARAEFLLLSVHAHVTMVCEQNKVILAGRHARSQTKVVFATRDKQQHDLHSTSLHMADETYSTMQVKGVVDDCAKAIFAGLVEVHAKDCEGYQQEDILLLAPGAEADVIPDLKIANNEVKCSHGASIGRINQELLFYAQARGLSLEAAKHLILQGFFASAFTDIPEETTNKFLAALFP